MYFRIPFWALAGLKIPSMYSINAQALDIMNQDWGSDIYQWTEPSEVSDVQGQSDLTQSGLFESTYNTPQNSGLTGSEDPDLFDWTDINAPTAGFDDTLAANTDFIATACTSDSSLPRISKRKKKPKDICPADSSSSSSSRVKQPDCRPESDICPIGKTAMCCDGEKQGWLKWNGFSVGHCINYAESDNCRLPVCQGFTTLYCCDFLGMAYMDPDAGYGCSFSFI